MCYSICSLFSLSNDKSQREWQDLALWSVFPLGRFTLEDKKKNTKKTKKTCPSIGACEENKTGCRPRGVGFTRSGFKDGGRGHFLALGEKKKKIFWSHSLTRWLTELLISSRRFGSTTRATNTFKLAFFFPCPLPAAAYVCRWLLVNNVCSG